MTYPDSPFGIKFDVISIRKLNKRQDDHHEDADNTEVADLNKLLQWLCTTPKITTYRVNTWKYDIEKIKTLLYSCLEKCSSQYTINDSMITQHPLLKDVLVLKSFQPITNPQDNLKEVIVDADCGAAILRGSHIFAPGVIGMESGTQRGDNVNVFADVVKKCKKGLKITYEDDRKIFLGVGEVLMVRNELFGENLNPRGIAIRMLSTTSGVPSLDTSEIPSDAILLQNIPSIICAEVLKPSPGEIVLDMCASPGNKTTHLGMLMKNQGVLIALDKTRNKLEVLRSNCAKYSLDFVQCYEFDSTKSYDPNLDGIDLKTGPPFPKEVFDKILLDAPCSNLGRRPQLFNNITDKEARSYVPLQRKLFTNAVNLLKKGGHLVYSTCTVMLGENEGIVSWALETFDCLELLPAVPNLGSPGWKGTSLTDSQRSFLQRYGPETGTDTVGFFISHFIKR